MVGRTIALRLTEGEEIHVQNMQGETGVVNDTLTSTALTVYNLPSQCPVVWAVHPVPQGVGRLRFANVITQHGATVYNSGTAEIRCPISGVLFIALTVGLEAQQPVNIFLRGGTQQPVLSSLSTHSNGTTMLSRQYLVQCDVTDAFYFEITDGMIDSDLVTLSTSLTVRLCEAERAIAFAVYRSSRLGLELSPLVPEGLPVAFPVVAFDTAGALQGGVYTITSAGAYYFYVSTGAQRLQAVGVRLMLNNVPVLELRRDSTSHNGVETLGRGVLLDVRRGDVLFVSKLKESFMYSDIGLHTSFFGMKIYD